MASKPIVVISCPPEAGHTNPLLPPATHLVGKGYEVHFIAGSQSKDAAEAAGAVFHPVLSVITQEKVERFFNIPDGPERFLYGLKAHFVDLAPNAMGVLRSVLPRGNPRAIPNSQSRDYSRTRGNGCLAILVGCTVTTRI